MVKLFFDLKLLLVFSLLCFGINRSGEGNEQRKKHFFSNHGFLTPLRIEEMYSSLSRRLQGSIVHLSKLILHDGIRAINLSRKSQGHRSMFKCAPIKTYHLGIRSKISKSTLADANNSRDWRIYADFAQVFINIARPLYAKEDIGLELDEMVYALDSTTINLCLTLFPWAKFRRLQLAAVM
jgi:hypothetical protein